MKTTLSAAVFVAGLALGSGIMAGEAYAHAMLVNATPKANETTASPAAVTLRFSGPIEAKFSQIELKDSSGKKQNATASVDPQDHKVLTAKLAAPLPAGGYTLSWRVVATDAHVMKGSYKFTVR